MVMMLIMVDNGHRRWLVFSSVARSYKTDGLPPHLARECNARLYFSTDDSRVVREVKYEKTIANIEHSTLDSNCSELPRASTF
jgi:hypothetical protein